MTEEPPKSGLWRAGVPLVLASGSATRRAMLEAVGIPVEVHPAEIDERAVEAGAARAGIPAAGRARLLARAKALAVSAEAPGRLVLGADQTLEGGGHPGAKARTREEAARFLGLLAGRTHRLCSAAALARDGAILWEATDVAALRMRPLSAAFVDSYLDALGEAALSSVGGYQIEGLGLHLFEKVDGAHATILGLPLMALLACFRRAELLPT